MEVVAWKWLRWNWLEIIYSKDADLLVATTNYCESTAGEVICQVFFGNRSRQRKPPGRPFSNPVVAMGYKQTTYRLASLLHIRSSRVAVTLWCYLPRHGKAKEGNEFP
jgi:hypothetical protein